MRLPNIPTIDVFSFWLGFAVATLLAFALYRNRERLSQAGAVFRAALRRLRESLVGGTERRLREEVAALAQNSHVAGSLFPLTQILLPPRLLAPHPLRDPTAPPADEDLNTVIPVLPEWPEMGGLYQIPTVGVEAAFRGNGNVMVLGGPGSGKTTLLAHLALRCAEGDEALFPEAPTPVFIHAGDLNLSGGLGAAMGGQPKPSKADLAQPLISAVQMRASALVAPQLPGHLMNRLKNGRCLIFLDGLDEMPLRQVVEVADWLSACLKEFRGNRVIAAAGLWGYAPLVQRGLAPIYMAPWGPADYRALIEKWGTVLEQARAKNRFIGPGSVEPQILMGWVMANNQGRSVFEISLKIWAAFTCDARGNRPGDWLEAYRLRLGLRAHEAPALGQVAKALLANEQTLGLPRADLVKVGQAAFTNAEGKVEGDAESFLDRLLRLQLLVRRAQDRLCFRYPHVLAHSAAVAVVERAEDAPSLLTPPWVLAYYYAAGSGDLTRMAAVALQQAPDLLYTDLFACAHWLRDAPASAPWRAEVFRRLSRLMVEKSLPENLRLQALAGLVSANDSAVLTLFKQVLTSSDPFTRRLAVLGLGASGEPAMVPFISPLFSDPYLDVRWAVALALAALGSEPALNALTQGMTEGEDNVRQACAQALARLPELGHPLLKEAVAFPDLLTRHAAVYGLFASRAEWALATLEDMQVHETEWLVRNAVVEAVAQWKTPPDRSPKPYPRPDSLGWLVAWAAANGTGVPPGKAAIEVLNRALKEGEEPYRCAAAEAIGRLCDPSAVRELYTVLREPAPLLRDAAFCALTQVAAAAAKCLPASMG
jgi:HEAT repeat protein